MKIFSTLSLGFALVAGSAFGAEMKGWISDASCGAGNANSSAAARECTANCIKGGAAPVFVTEKDGKVFQLSNQEEAKKHLKGKVAITGEVKGDKIVVAKIVDIAD